MDPDIITTFFDRILGAFIFITAITMAVLLVNQISSYATVTKENYADDGVYSESALAVTDETVISREELKALLVGCPNQSITIRDEVSNWVLEITSGFGIENSIKVANAASFSAGASVTVFGINRWEPEKLDLDKWIQAQTFKMRNITSSDGSVHCYVLWGGVKMDSISKFFNILILVVGIFFVSTLILANLDDRVTEESITTVVTKFSDNVRKQGKITQKMYQSFVDQLDAHNILFNIEMVYTKDVYSPIDGGNYVTTEESFYQEDIVAGLFNGEDDSGAMIDGAADGEVRFNQGDSFYVSVTNRSQTLAQKFSSYFPWIRSTEDRISARAGGLVRDEEWSD